jgi:hypothetical protein
VEETAKGVGHTVVEGAKVTGEKIQEAGKAAEPKAETAWRRSKAGSTLPPLASRVFSIRSLVTSAVIMHTLAGVFGGRPSRLR